MRVYHLGHEVQNVYFNMALDEIMLEASIRENSSCLRSYEIDRPSILLGHNQYFDNIHKHALESFDLTRRLTAGGIAICSDDAVFFSVSGRGNPLKIKKEVVEAVLHILKDYDAEYDILASGNTIRIDRKPVGSVGVYACHGAALCQVMLSIHENANYESLRGLRLPENEKKKLENLKSLSCFIPQIDRKDLMESFSIEVTKDLHRQMHHEKKQAIYKAAQVLASQKYRSPYWIKYGSFRRLALL